MSFRWWLYSVPNINASSCAIIDAHFLGCYNFDLFPHKKNSFICISVGKKIIRDLLEMLWNIANTFYGLYEKSMQNISSKLNHMPKFLLLLFYGKLTLKNSYLIHLTSKNSKFYGRDSYKVIKLQAKNHEKKYKFISLQTSL